jgi:hypothetical protein
MNAPDGSHSMPAGSVPGAGQVGEPGRPRWLVLGVVGLAQLMIVSRFEELGMRQWSRRAAMLEVTFERDLDEQRGAAAGRAGDFERAAERLDPVAEPDQP